MACAMCVSGHAWTGGAHDILTIEFQKSGVETLWRRWVRRVRLAGLTGLCGLNREAEFIDSIHDRINIAS